MIDGQASASGAPPRGALLRQERLRRGLSLIDAGQRTRIQPRLLDAIERDDYRALPAPVFTVGLIGLYARYLGIDPQPVVAAYKASAGSTPSPVPRPAPIPAPRRRGPRALLAPVVAVLLLALAGYLYQQYAAFVAGAGPAPGHPVVGGIAAVPTSRPMPPPAPTAGAPLAAATPTAAPAPAIPPPPATPTVALPTEVPTATPIRGVRVDAQVSGRVWLQVESDDRVVFVGILHAGDRRTWTAERKLMIWSGNAGSVTVTYNGKPLGPLGRPGEVVKVTWTATP